MEEADAVSQVSPPHTPSGVSEERVCPELIRRAHPIVRALQLDNPELLARILRDDPSLVMEPVEGHHGEPLVAAIVRRGCSRATLLTALHAGAAVDAVGYQGTALEVLARSRAHDLDVSRSVSSCVPLLPLPRESIPLRPLKLLLPGRLSDEGACEFAECLLRCGASLATTEGMDLSFIAEGNGHPQLAELLRRWPTVNSARLFRQMSRHRHELVLVEGTPEKVCLLTLPALARTKVEECLLGVTSLSRK